MTKMTYIATKRLLSARIDPDIIKRLRKFLIQQYGSTYYLSFVVEQALKQYLDLIEKGSQTHEKEHKIERPSGRKHIELVKWLGKRYSYQLLLSEVEKYIEAEIGLDRRTKKKYREFLLKNGFIKVVKHVGREVICEVDSKKVYEFLKRYFSEEELKDFAVAECTNRQS